MFTTQWFAGLTARITAVDFTRLMARNISGACPGTRVTTPHELAISGRSAAQIQANCPRLAATGNPETVMMLVVAGEQDIMVRQASVRSVPAADDLEWSEAVLGGTVLCKPGAAVRPDRLGSGPLDRAFEAPEWRTHRTERRAAKTGCLCQRRSVRAGSRSGAPPYF